MIEPDKKSFILQYVELKEKRKFLLFKQEIEGNTNYLLIKAKTFQMASAIAVQYLTNLSHSNQSIYQIQRLEKVSEAKHLQGDYQSQDYISNELYPKITYKCK